eukprot:Pgem_evm1s4390
MKAFIKGFNTPLDTDKCLKTLKQALLTEDQTQATFFELTNEFKNLLSSSKGIIFGSLEKWKNAKIHLEKLCHIVNYLIEYQSFSSNDFQNQYESIRVLTKTQNDKKKLEKEIVELHTTLLVPTIANNEFMVKTMKEKKDDVNMNSKVMSKFISCRTTLLNNVKKFLPEKLLDKEFLQNVGLGVDEKHANGVSRDLNHYLRNCSLLGIYYGKLEEENIIKPLQTLSMNNARKNVFVIESGYFAGQKKKYCLKQNIIPKHSKHSSEEEQTQKEEQIQKEKRRFYRQCYLLKDLKHPNIINIVAGFEGMYNGISNSLCMAMPFYKNGDLGKWIADHPPHTRLLSVCYPIINGTLEGLLHLHQNDIVHCDVKPENIFLNDNLQPIIGDFDDAKEINTN